jgi:hypothetical protein
MIRSANNYYICRLLLLLYSVRLGLILGKFLTLLPAYGLGKVENRLYSRTKYLLLAYKEMLWSMTTLLEITLY